MRRRAVAFPPILLLASCALPSPPPPPAAFTGPVAHLSMTEFARGSFAANVVIVKKINGQDFQGEIDPSQPPPDTPLSAQTGPISTITIPVGPGTYSLAAYSIFQAPIFALAMDEYCMVGDVKFTPVANGNYNVEGIFTPTYSAIWIEDATTKAVMGNKIEIHGSATINKWALMPTSVPCS